MPDSDDIDLPEDEFPAQRVLADASNERAHRAALIATAAVLIMVLVALPFALRSMASTLFGEQEAILYDLGTDSIVPPVVTEPILNHGNYVNIAVVNLDPATGEATFAVSGNRTCPECLPHGRAYPAGPGRQRRSAPRPAASGNGDPGARGPRVQRIGDAPRAWAAQPLPL